MRRRLLGVAHNLSRVHGLVELFLPAVSPADLPSFVLLFEPLHQRLEVGDHRRAVHLAATGEGFERIGPGLRGTHRQHLVQAFAHRLVAVERAAVQRAFPAGLFSRRLVELKLEEAREEIAGVGRVAGNVILRTGIKRRADPCLPFRKCRAARASSGRCPPRAGCWTKASPRRAVGRRCRFPTSRMPRPSASRCPRRPGIVFTGYVNREQPGNRGSRGCLMLKISCDLSPDFFQ